MITKRIKQHKFKPTSKVDGDWPEVGFALGYNHKLDFAVVFYFLNSCFYHLYRVTLKNGTAYFPQYVDAITPCMRYLLLRKIIPRSAMYVQ